MQTYFIMVMVDMNSWLRITFTPAAIAIAASPVRNV
jgi:hypothetical protein